MTVMVSPGSVSHRALNELAHLRIQERVNPPPPIKAICRQAWEAHSGCEITFHDCANWHLNVLPTRVNADGRKGRYVARPLHVMEMPQTYIQSRLVLHPSDPTAYRKRPKALLNTTRIETSTPMIVRFCSRKHGKQVGGN